MPQKLKKSVKTYNRKTGKTTTEHFYLHATKLSELKEIANDIGLQHDVDYVFDMDKPMKMARLSNIEGNVRVTDANYQELLLFSKLM